MYYNILVWPDFVACHLHALITYVYIYIYIYIYIRICIYVCIYSMYISFIHKQNTADDYIWLSLVEISGYVYAALS